MTFFKIEVHDEEFLDWLDIIENQFVKMTETMIRVAETVKEETQPLTPLETGKLSRSFRWKILTDNSRMKVLQIQMSALNERTGYDYAWIQHEANYRHGMTELGFFNYSRMGTSIDEDGFSTSTWRIGTEPEFHRGQRKYLYWGIKYSEDTAFEIIEEDYLSLFTGGFIV